MSAPRPINMGFRYDDDDYASLMDAYVKQKNLKLSDGNKGIILNQDGTPYLIDGQVISFWDVLVIHEPGPRSGAKLNAFKEYLIHLVKWQETNPGYGQYRLLVPFHRNVGHWSLLRWQIDIDARKAHTVLFDSSSDSIGDLVQDLNEIEMNVFLFFQESFNIKEITRANQTVPKQPDSDSCGPIVATMMAFDAGLDEIQFPDNSEAYGHDYSPTDIAIIRERHAQVIGGDFQDKQHVDVVTHDDALRVPPSHSDQNIEQLVQSIIDKFDSLIDDAKNSIPSYFYTFVKTELALSQGYNETIGKHNSATLKEIKDFFKRNFVEFKELLVAFFQINGDTAPDEFIWASGGRDNLTAVLYGFCLKKSLLQVNVEQHDEDDSSNSSDADDNFTGYIFNGAEYYFNGKLNRAHKQHGLCEEKFHPRHNTDEDATYYSFKGNYDHGVKTHGLELSSFSNPDINTYFMGYWDQDGDFYSGSVQCVVLGAEPFAPDLYLIFDGKIKTYQAIGSGELRIYNSLGGIITTAIVSFVDGCMGETLKVTGDQSLVKKIFEYFNNKDNKFTLGRGKTSENSLATIRSSNVIAELENIHRNQQLLERRKLVEHRVLVRNYEATTGNGTAKRFKGDDSEDESAAKDEPPLKAVKRQDTPRPGYTE